MKMGYREIKEEYVPTIGKRRAIYAIDSAADVETLPTNVAATSIAVMIKEWLPMWMLNFNNEWCPVNLAAKKEMNPEEGE